MKIARLKIDNFRGIAVGELHFPGNSVLVGDNNTGKSTVLEAIELVLGPDRSSRISAIDEHDFHAGRYIGVDGVPVEIKIEVVIIDLNDEQTRHFKDHLEWWNEDEQKFLDGPPAESTENPSVLPALRVGFRGSYDEAEDDFCTSTYYLSPTLENGEHIPFRTSDKRLCGFLLLRTLRTGSRALSLEKGSLLDIILRLQDKRLQMWEDVLQQLRKLPVAENPDLGITSILSTVQEAIRSFVPSDWADNPHMRVSDLTRDSLRKVLTVFMSTGAKREDGAEYAAPFQHQGTGTINTLVLSLLSLIAELKQNVIFAMEEPEIAIPPHTQKRIITSMRNKSAQVLFTSHSPYILEEFAPSEVLVLTRQAGKLTASPADFPDGIKPKAYRTQFRTRFAEALLARRILIVEGRTEYDAFPIAARRLNELQPDRFKTLEALGIAVMSADTDSQIIPLAKHFIKLGKVVFAAFDKQDPETKKAIEAVVPHSFESTEKGFENVVLNGVPEAALRRYAKELVDGSEWPQHLANSTPTTTVSLEGLKDALRQYLRWSKGAGDAAAILECCSLDEMPAYVVATISTISAIADPPKSPASAKEPAATEGDATPE